MRLARLPRTGIAMILAATFCSTATFSAIAPPASAQLLEGLFQGAARAFTLNNLSESQEAAYGERINQQLVSQGQVRLSNDRRLNSIVTGIGQRLARTSDRPNFPYRFYVVADRNINAFSTMGGFVYVTTGMLANIRSEEQLAGVLSHEIAHITARHSIEQMRQAALTQGLLRAIGQDDNLIVNIGATLFERRHSRNDEYEADDIGLRNLVRAGYPANGLPDFLRGLQSSRNPEFLSTHPSSPSRVARLEETIRREGLPTGRR